MDAQTAQALRDARDSGELFDACQSFLERRFPKCGRVALFLVLPEGQISLKKLKGATTPNFLAELEGPLRAFLKDIRDRRKAHLVTDARKESLFREIRISERTFISALGMRICGPRGAPLGVIYLDHPRKTAAFTQGDLAVVREVADAIGTRLAILNKAEARKPRRARPKPKPKPEPEPEKKKKTKSPKDTSKRPGRGLLAAGATVLLAVGAWWLLVGGPESSTPAPAGATPTPAAEAVKTTKVASVAEGYRRYLDAGKFQEAYELLSPKVKQRVAYPDYKRHVSDWLSDRTNRTQLRAWTMTVKEQQGSRAVVRLEPPPGHARSWSWGLVYEQSGWKLETFYGGPGLPRKS